MGLTKLYNEVLNAIDDIVDMRKKDDRGVFKSNLERVEKSLTDFRAHLSLAIYSSNVNIERYTICDSKGNPLPVSKEDNGAFVAYRDYKALASVVALQNSQVSRLKDLLSEALELNTSVGKKVALDKFKKQALESELKKQKEAL